MCFSYTLTNYLVLRRVSNIYTHYVCIKNQFCNTYKTCKKNIGNVFGKFSRVSDGDCNIFVLGESATA